ncbi:MAG: ComF family protein [Oscillospiraceae bacterium]|jgi:ComF family protein|nr:ComF family protein [Oscillospiraceae bacterium]
MSGLKKGLLRLLFPPKCPFCRRILSGEELMCGECAAGLPYTDRKADTGGSFYSQCVSSLYYTGAVRKAVLAFKFHGRASYAECFGRLMSESVRKKTEGRFDALTWVPLSRARLRKRGYSQARLLAEVMGRELGYTPERLLDKPGNIRPQSRIHDSSQRRANVAGAYKVHPGAELDGRRILLVDDIFTTGATLAECSKIMLLAGAEEVVCAVLCRGKKTDDFRTGHSHRPGDGNGTHVHTGQGDSAQRALGAGGGQGHGARAQSGTGSAAHARQDAG